MSTLAALTGGLTLATGAGASALKPSASQPSAAPPSLARAELAGARLTKPGAYVLRANPGQLDHLEREVKAAGGTVTHRLGIINGLAVKIPAKGLRAVASAPSLASASPDAAIFTQSKKSTTTTVPTTTVPTPKATVAGDTTNSTTVPSTTTPSTTVPSTTTPSTTVPPAGPDEMTAVAGDLGSLRYITTNIRADQMWAKGVTGAGVDIAVIDTGVAPVQGLAGKIINGPDISLDAPYAPVLGVDAYGHGTHMASIAAGLDPGTTNLSDPSKFVGVAPGARIVNVKVGAFDGATDVSQVIAGIDWVVQHRKDPGMNIRVLNLSYGTPSAQASVDDPLSWAAEAAWRYGIVVVASAGNDGANTKVLSPAYNPLILAVGAVDQTKGKLTATDFTAASGSRQPDLWAPGTHVLGLRVPNSFVDVQNPAARVGTRMIRGTGTSQATAVVSGAAALLVAANPTATPSQIKAALVDAGKKVKGTTGDSLDIATADQLLKAGSYASLKDGSFPGNIGKGSLELARGNGPHLVFNGVTLVGEKDIFGKPWDPKTTADNVLYATSWVGGVFNGSSWAGSSWAGSSWAGVSWAGSSWAGSSWAGSSWAGSSWAGSSWAGSSWAGVSWAGSSWAGSSWAGSSWAGVSWAGKGWQGAVWG